MGEVERVSRAPGSVYFAQPNTNMEIAAGGGVTARSNNPRQIQFGIEYNLQ